MIDNELTITPPNGNMEKATAIRAAIIARQHELVSRVDALAHALADDAIDLKAAADSAREVEEAAEDLRTRCKRAIAAELDGCGLAAIVRQVDARLMTYSTKCDDGTYAAVMSAVKAVKNTIKAKREAAKGPADILDFALGIEAPYALYEKLLAWLDKQGIAYAARRVEGKADKAKLVKYLEGAK